MRLTKGKVYRVTLGLARYRDGPARGMFRWFTAFRLRYEGGAAEDPNGHYVGGGCWSFAGMYTVHPGVARVFYDLPVLGIVDHEAVAKEEWRRLWNGVKKAARRRRRKGVMV